MKRGILVLFCLLLAIFSAVPAFSQAETQNLVTRVIESFDNPAESPWTAIGSKFVTEGYPEVAYAEAWPFALFGNNEQGQNLQAFGVRAKFDRKGYNYLEVMPVTENGDGTLSHRPLTIPGNVKQLDLWVWGSLYDYYLEIHLSDYKGVTHVVDMGNLNFRGWKNLRVAIPNYIPQTQAYIPFQKALELEKIVVWTRPEEAVDGFNIFFDQIKVLTDDFVSRFDGDELADPSRIEEIFGETE